MTDDEGAAPLFTLSMRGGAPEERLHRRRPLADEMPWGSIDHASLDPAMLEEARKVWTNGTFTEYAAAAAFSALTTALLECGAPVDVIAMAADIVVDEMHHVELSARLTTELGGGVPYRFDLGLVSPVTTPGARPLLRAAELAVTTSCVSESLSVPAMGRSRALATVPLVRAVLDRLVADEGPHARIGWYFLDFAADQLTGDERRHLAELALSTVRVYRHLWQEDPCDGCAPPLGLGGHDARGRAALRKAVEMTIAKPLAEYGIVLDLAAVDA